MLLGIKRALVIMLCLASPLSICAGEQAERSRDPHDATIIDGHIKAQLGTGQ